MKEHQEYTAKGLEQLEMEFDRALHTHGPNSPKLKEKATILSNYRKGLNDQIEAKRIKEARADFKRRVEEGKRLDNYFDEFTGE